MSVDARIEVAKNNAQMRANADDMAIQAREMKKENFKTALNVAIEQAYSITDSITEENANENTRRFSEALTDEIMSGNFEYKEGNPENGLCETWDDYWGNYTRFKDSWINGSDADGNPNVVGGAISKARTATSIDNYLSNSKTDIANSRKTQLWEQKVEMQNEVVKATFNEIFDEDTFQQDMSIILSNQKFAEVGITSLDGLANVTAYGIDRYYNRYAAEREKWLAGEPSNYYEAANDLKVASKAYTSQYGEENFKRYMASSDKEDITRSFNINQAVYSKVDGLNSDLLAECDNSGGTTTALNAYLEKNKIGEQVQGLNGEWIGLTATEKESAQKTYEAEITKRWNAQATRSASMYTNLMIDLNTATSGTAGLFISSIKDIQNFRDKATDKDYNKLTDSYIEYAVKHDSSLYTTIESNGRKKEAMEACATLGQAQDMYNDYTKNPNTVYTAEQIAEMEEKATKARTTLYAAGYWGYAAEAFKFGVESSPSDDIGAWKNEETSGIWKYMESNGGDFATAAIKSGFFDVYIDRKTSSSSGSSLPNDGTFVTSQKADLERYIKIKGGDFFDVAFNSGDILTKEYTTKDLTEMGDYDALDEAAKVKGWNTEDEGFKKLKEIYGESVKALSTNGVFIGDEASLKGVFSSYLTLFDSGSTSTEQENAISTITAYQKSAMYTAYPEAVEYGYLFDNSGPAVDSSHPYHRDVILYALQNEIDGKVSSILQAGTQEDMANLCYQFGAYELQSEIMDAKDWKGLCGGDFVTLLTDAAATSYENYYYAFADKSQGGQDLSRIEFMTSTGGAKSIKDTIEKNTEDGYLAATEAWLRMQYQYKADAVYGQPYQGVSPEGTSIGDDGGLLSPLYRTVAAEIAFSVDPTGKQMAIDSYTGRLTPEAIESLEKTDSINLALISTGLFDSSDTVQSILAAEFGPSVFTTTLNDRNYTGFAFYESKNTALLQKCAEVKERAKNGENTTLLQNEVKDLLISEAQSYIDYASSSEAIDALEYLSKQNGSSFILTDSLTEYKETVEDGGEGNAHGIFSDINKNYSKMYASFIGGDMKTRVNMLGIFSSNGTSTKDENMASLYSLGKGIASGEVADTDKNAISVIAGVMAYNQIKHSSISVSTTDLTSGEIKEVEDRIINKIVGDDLDGSLIYEWYALQTSIQYTLETVAQYRKYGFDDELQYYYSEDKGSYFVSKKGNNVQINQDGSISITLPENVGGETIYDVSVYSDSAKRQDVLNEAFNPVGEGELNNGNFAQDPQVVDFQASRGVERIYNYNVKKEYLDGLNQTDDEIVLMAYPAELKFISDHEIVEQGINVDLNKSVTYDCYPMRLSAVKSIYDYYKDNGLPEKADELCSMLTETQANYVKTTSQTAVKEKAAAEKKAEEEKLKTFSGFMEDRMERGTATLVDVDEFLRNADDIEKAKEEIKEYQKSVPADSVFASTDVDTLASYSSWAKDNPRPSDKDVLSFINGAAYPKSAIRWVDEYINNGVINPKGKKWTEGSSEYVTRILSDVAKETVVYDEAFKGVIEEYSDGITTDQIDAVLGQHEDEIDVYAAEMKKAISSGDIPYLKDNRYYKSIDSYIDNKVKNIKQQMKMKGKNYQPDYLRLFGGSAEPQKDVAR